MKLSICLAIVLLLMLRGSACFAQEYAEQTTQTGDPRVRAWDHWGNHRAVVRVAEPHDAVRIHLPWRLPFKIDSLPAQGDLPKNAIFVVDAATGKPVDHIAIINRNDDSGDLAFQPVTVPGDYFVYYLLVMDREFAKDWQQVEKGEHWKYPAWPAPDAKWLAEHHLGDKELVSKDWEKLPEAQFVAFESMNEFHRFTEMERAASQEEVAQLMTRFADRGVLLFPEDRRNTIRMKDRLPVRWTKEGPKNDFKGAAKRNEFYTFQIGVFAASADLPDVGIELESLRLVNAPATAPATGYQYQTLAMECFNNAGVDWKGRSFTKQVSVGKGLIRPLWFGVQIPAEATAGTYRGTVAIAPAGRAAQRVAIEIAVEDDLLPDHGDGDLWRFARLRWLNSTIAQDDEPTQPFLPLKVADSIISCLGRAVEFQDTGLPKSIVSYFSPNNTRIVDQPREILAAPVNLAVEGGDGNVVPWAGGKLEFIQKSNSAAEWQSTSRSGDLVLRCEGSMEFDGFIEYRLNLTAARDADVRDIRLEIPLRRDAAKYLMGMGRKGGTRPAEYHWKWGQEKHQDAVWVGDVNAGLRCQLFGENYERPNTNIYYSEHPLNLPPAWWNGGQGGCDVVEAGDDSVIVRPYSGPRHIRAGETLHFYFNLLVTPFKTLETDAHWKSRYWHRYTSGPAEDTVPTMQQVKEAGCNIITLHGNGKQNPFINYPFVTAEIIRNYVDKAHSEGFKAKIYYTVRELSNHVAEMWALRSLDGEVLALPKGSGLSWTPGGYSWNAEHIGPRDYRGAWVDLGATDASHLTSGMSRWHNYYLEGLQWLIRNVGIDGIYIDDAAYDRTVIRRARKIMDRSKPGMLIDLHSWNHFDKRAGFGNCAILYMELMPYLDSLWFGEDFDYGSPADYWLVEISGIPFGLMGEMMSGGNPWLGMVYGMTGRMGWGEEGPGRRSPSAMWKLWDQFGIQEAETIGYWDPACPVRTDDPQVLATVYKRKGKALISLGNFGDGKSDCHLKIDWAALGMDPSQSRLIAPTVQEVQAAAVFRASDAIPVAPHHGWLLILQP